MKPLKAPTFFIKNLLITFAACFALLGYIFASKDLTFHSGLWGYLSHGEVKESIVLGIIPTFNLAIFLSFICLYLSFEFYGFKTAFYGTINLCLLYVASFFIFKYFVQYALIVEQGSHDNIIKNLIIVDKLVLVKMVLSIAIGFITTFFLAASIKKLTRNYFMFFRYPIAAIVGFGLTTTILTHFDHPEVLDPNIFMAYGGNAAAQFVGLILLALVPLYFLRLILGLFRGKVKSLNDQADDGYTNTKDGPLFKPATSDDTLPPPPAEEEPKEDTTQEENTLSEKIHVDEIKD